jgi:hypothetical protein
MTIHRQNPFPPLLYHSRIMPIISISMQKTTMKMQGRKKQPSSSEDEKEVNNNKSSLKRSKRKKKKTIHPVPIGKRLTENAHRSRNESSSSIPSLSGNLSFFLPPPPPPSSSYRISNPTTSCPPTSHFPRPKQPQTNRTIILAHHRRRIRHDLPVPQWVRRQFPFHIRRPGSSTNTNTATTTWRRRLSPSKSALLLTLRRLGS